MIDEKLIKASMSGMIAIVGAIIMEVNEPIISTIGAGIMACFMGMAAVFIGLYLLG